ncbi:HGxxPAAW family protein [Kribbella sp. NPDC056861]|uniref:HGxxPAAW family protein n=1 Tax=Kribbella sp. NPDC056861 TaxID=3154857 RepID=UPI003424749E
MDNTTTDQPVTYESDEAHAGGHHGSTPAAWTAVVIVLAGFTLGAIAMVMGPNWLLFWISVGIAVAGGLVGKVMQLLGFGAKSSDHS